MCMEKGEREIQRGLVSVIVPVYNVENYMDKCLRSICGQTYQNLEILVVDDGSTDLSGKKCDEWSKKDSRIKVKHQENQGLSAARNTAIDVCSGEWITFVDSDDEVDEKYVEILLGLTEKYNVSISQCLSKDIKLPVRTQEKMESGVMDSRDFLLSDHYRTMAWGKIYKREIFTKARYPYGKIHEDVALTYRLVYESERVAYTNQILYFCNGRPNSINSSGKFYKERLAILQFYKEQVEYYREKKENTLEKATLRSYAYALLTNYYKTRKILKEKKIASRIKAEYREIWKSVKKDSGISLKSRGLLAACYVFPSLWERVTGKG